MDILDVRKMKAQLEKDLKERLNMFEKTTRVTIQSIDFDRIHLIGSESIISEIYIKAEV